MPRYFFDVRTDGRTIRDETGMDLPHAGQIWPEIARLIHDCIYAHPPGDSARLFDVTVRDEHGTVIERSTSTSGTSDPALRSESFIGRLGAASRDRG